MFQGLCKQCTLTVKFSFHLVEKGVLFAIQVNSVLRKYYLKSRIQLKNGKFVNKRHFQFRKQLKEYLLWPKTGPRKRINIESVI